jgi:hypothetical protein
MSTSTKADQDRAKLSGFGGQKKNTLSVSYAETKKNCNKNIRPPPSCGEGDYFGRATITWCFSPPAKLSAFSAAHAAHTYQNFLLLMFLYSFTANSELL